MGLERGLHRDRCLPAVTCHAHAMTSIPSAMGMSMFRLRSRRVGGTVIAPTLGMSSQDVDIEAYHTPFGLLLGRLNY